MLRLPSYLSRLHPVFHVSLLEPYSDPSDFHPHAEPDPLVLDSSSLDSSPDISEFLDSRKLGQRYEYLVRWKGLSPDEDSWIPLSDVPTTSNELLERFHRRHPRAIRPHRLVLDKSAYIPLTTDISSSLAPQILPAPVPASASVVPTVAPIVPSAAPAVPVAAPRTPSPLPVHPEDPRRWYVPPTQTTTRSGRVSRPPQRLDL